MTSTPSPDGQRFSTHDLKVAAIARATGAALLSIDDSNPQRVTWTFDLPADFHVQLLAGKVKVDGGAVVAALDTLQGFVKNPRRPGRG